MKILKIILLIHILIFSNHAIAQHTDSTGAEPPSLVKWITLKEAQELNKKTPKPILIDFYTGWCGWCKHMMKTTYSTPDLANYINQWFYPVKFNAETKDTVYYRDTAYVNKGTGPRATHDLTFKFLGDHISYPSTVFITNNYQYNLNSAGYLDVKTIEPILIYVLENIFRTTAYEDFKKNFNKAFFDTVATDKNLPKWYSFNEALSLNKAKPKKLLIYMHTGWCNGCRIMYKTSFSDTAIANYLDKNFYLVDFNIESADTISYNGTSYQNNHANGVPFHQLAMTLTGNKLALPTAVFVDESYNTLDVIPNYLTGEVMLPVVIFYGEGAYKNVKWDDFAKKFREEKMQIPK